MKHPLTFLALLTLLPFLTPLALVAQIQAFTPAEALDLVSVSVREMTDNGAFLILTSGTRRDRMGTDHKRYRDPSYLSPSFTELLVMNTETREQWRVFDEKIILGGTSLSPDSKLLAVLTESSSGSKIFVYDLVARKLKELKIKSDKTLAGNSLLEWSPDQRSLLISLRESDWQQKADSMYREATVGPVTVYDGSRPFLKWDEIGLFASRSIPAMLDVSKGSVQELLPGGQYSSMRFAKPGDRLHFTEVLPQKTSYDRKGATKYGIYSLILGETPVRDTLFKVANENKQLTWNEDNTRFAWADSGKIMVRSVYEKEAVRIGKDTTEIVKKDTVKVKFSVMRWSPDESKILAGSKSGYWLIDVATQSMERVYELPEDASKGWRMSKDGKKFLYSFSDGDMPSDYYLCNESFTDPVRLTTSNPWIETRTLTRSELVKYRDSDGKELNGVLYYPVNYEEGKRYPLVCEIYETFFDNGFNSNMNILANAGYFGFRPSVNLIEGYPGEAWIKGITAGINLLIDRGLVDEKKLGVHGTSYGGYATSLLITQTDRFAAAINISGKVNIISFLGDSPKIGTRNYAAAENGQDRIGETLWDAPLKYFATTAVLYADRIKTPHLLLTGEGDWNVPGTNSRELYYAMRRLGKEVMWVNYYNGGHGAGWASDEADYFDQWGRIIDWYDKHFNKDN